LPPKLIKQRLDLALVVRGLAETRSKAQSLIMARRILVNGFYVDKAGATVTSEDVVLVEALEHPWVGRGGMKLAHAVAHFGIQPLNKVCVDIGASTGGFTDVLLNHGATKVYAIDVGHGQLDVKLQNDPRVVNREKTNARYLQPEDFEERIELVSIDVSFISLKLILPAVATFLEGELLALIKPQFEVGRHEVGKGGIVRDEGQRNAVVASVIECARGLGFDVKGVVDSPIKGAEGNVEFLMHAVLTQQGPLESGHAQPAS
jgi:23S rRNA (cytidine1920-2'-O)/16S rRNA (cytidine1409-2'-O)-methyltransferase